MKYSITHWLQKRKNPAINNNLSVETSVQNYNEAKSPTTAKPAVTESLLTYLLILEVIRRTLPVESEKANSKESKSSKDKLKDNSYYKKWKKRTAMLR